MPRVSAFTAETFDFRKHFVDELAGISELLQSGIQTPQQVHYGFIFATNERGT